jgi:hypothetical protein
MIVGRPDRALAMRESTSAKSRGATDGN